MSNSFPTFDPSGGFTCRKFEGRFYTQLAGHGIWPLSENDAKKLHDVIGEALRNPPPPDMERLGELEAEDLRRERIASQ